MNRPFRAHDVYTFTCPTCHKPVESTTKEMRCPCGYAFAITWPVAK